MAAIVLSGVTKEFPGGAVAVAALDLEIADGEFLVLVGPSGSGKTTVLRMVGGLEEAAAGWRRRPSCSACPTCSNASPEPSPAASGNGWRWAGPSCGNRRPSSWTS